jgi:hypothetical protein
MEYTYTSNVKNIFKSELFTITLLSMFAFLVPIVFAKITLFPNQLLIGTIVNGLLAYSALRFNIWKSLPIILLPSIGALISGIVFGQFTFFLLYLIPAIWLGNYILGYFVKKYSERKFFATTIASIAKTSVIFGFTLILYLFNVVPAMFLIPMSIIQLVTALCGIGLILGFIRN